MNRILSGVLSAFLLLSAGCSAPRPSPSGGDPQALAQAGARIIDVRTPGEYNAGHLDGAINIPHDQIGQRISQVTTNKAEPLLIHCRSGGRSAMAKATLEAAGYSNVIDLGSLDNARLVTGK